MSLRPRPFVFLVLSATVAVMGASCSTRGVPTNGVLNVDGGGVSDGGDAVGASDAGDAGDAGDGSDAGPSAMTIVVYERRWPDFAALTTAPLAGISVTADLPDGTRKTVATDATGIASFPGVDWSKGTATVTAYRTGSPLVSRVGITREGAHQRLWVRAVPPKTIPVTGTAINFDPKSQYLAVSSPQGGGRYQNLVSTSANNFQFLAPANTPFTLVATTFTSIPEDPDAGPVNGRDEETTFKAWVRLDFPPSIDPITNVVFDFAKPLPVSRTHGTIQFSQRRSSRLYTDAQPDYTVGRVGNIGFFGAPDRTRMSADGFSSAFQGPYVRLTGLDPVNTEYHLFLGSGLSFVRSPGYPVDGADVGGFIEEPEMVVPSDPNVAGKFTDPIVWRTIDSNARATLLLDRGGSIGIVWEITSASTAPSITLPKPPDGVDVTAVLGAKPLVGFIQLGVECDPPDDPWYWSCLRGSIQTQPLFHVSPP